MSEALNATVVLLIAAIALCACQPGVPSSRGTPIVRGEDGGSASLTIITCPPTEARAMAVGDLIQFLASQDELVIARSGGAARLVINACVTMPSAQASRR